MFTGENGDRFVRIVPLILVVVAGIVLMWWAAGRADTGPALPDEEPGTTVSIPREVGLLMIITGVACSVAAIRPGRQARRMRNSGIVLLLIAAISALGIYPPTRLGDSFTTGRHILLALAFLGIAALALRWHGVAGGLSVLAGVLLLVFLFLSVILDRVGLETSLGTAIVEAIFPLLTLGVFPITAGGLFTAASFDVV
jgi:hypothetical protein